MKRFLWWLAPAVVALLPALAPALECTDVVKTQAGPVRGFAEAESAACGWLGLPYAAPPVGELRWKAPAPPVAHEEVFVADQPAAACLQPKQITAGGDLSRISEDCLTLNVWRPKKEGSFPVMLWIHGGGFRTGAGAFDIYNGARLAAKHDIVVVSINYRLGPFGFLALPELAGEDPHGSAGNYALLDMVQALRWVHNNIAAFGGNPERVTVSGQSAGGISACIMMVTPLAEGLVHQAIIESGPCDQAESLEDGYRRGDQLAAEMGCTGPDRLACLRALPGEKLTPEGGNLMLGGGMMYLPHLDHYLLKTDAVSAIHAGDYRKMPVLIGSTRDEIKLYTMTIVGTGLVPRFAMKKLMRKLMGGSLDRILELYDFADYRRPINLFQAVATDLAIGSRTYDLAETLSPAAPVYYYRFDWDEVRFPHKMGAFHSLEVPFVFGALDLDFTLAKLVANKKVIAGALPLVDDVMAYWANFVKTGDPNGSGLTAWPRYDAQAKPRLHLDTAMSVQPLPAREVERYNYLNTLSLTGLQAAAK